MTKKLISLTALALLANVLCFGQASMTSTTLSAALNATALTFKVASATGISAPANPISAGAIGTPTGSSYILLFVDKEAMAVDAVSSTTVTVKRGFAGTQATAHVSGAKVWVGPANLYAALDPSGSCTAAALPVLPRVVTTTGNVFNCGNGQWLAFTAYTAKAVVGAVIASATTIAPTNPIFHVSGTTAVVTITVPPAFPAGGSLYIIPDGAFTTTTAGNISLASTAVANKTLIMTWDGTKWNPSY
jgi:hypothetical protein